MRSMVAGRAELSRSLFVARSRDVIGKERDWCGAWWRGALSSRGVCLWHRFVTSSGWRGTVAEHCGGGALSSRGVCLWHGVVTSSGWRGTGAEHGGGEG